MPRLLRKRALPSLVLVTVAFPLLAGEWSGLSSDGPLPVDLDQAPGLFQQCSRSAPKPVGPIWLPSEKEITEMEQRLVEYFASLGSERFTDPRWSLRPYRGQHVGFGFGTDRYIYGSYSNLNRAETGKVIILCDGGPSSWGILYNLKNGEFSDFDVNGR